jgi:hypothetical protein
MGRGGAGQAGALTADPYLEYDVCLTLTTAGAAAGPISLRGSVVNGT